MRTHLNVSCIGILFATLAGCAFSSEDDQSAKPGDKDTTYTTNSGNMRVHFETEASADLLPDDGIAAVSTECGDAMGVHIAISDSTGASQDCDESWAPVEVSGSYAGGASGDHYIADCLFVVSPGIWSIDDMSAIDVDSNALSCCTSSYPSAVSVSESVTTEVAGLIQCDTIGNGGLDIYTTVNTPPEITNVTISPSKFGGTCSAIGLTATAVDPEGDAVSYSWAVEDAPTGAVYSLYADGSSAWFASASLGDYMLSITASDDLGAAHSLYFPLHIVGDDDGTDCDVDALTLAASLEVDVDL